MKRFEIASVVNRLGISANYKGYDYIISGVQMIMQNTSLAHQTTKVVSLIAKEYDTTNTGVDRAIRVALKGCLYRADSETVKKIFGYNIGNKIPKVSEFLATVADYLSMVGDENGR